MTKEQRLQTSCPFRGTHNDPEVRFGFPAANTYCYKASPPAAIEKSHQSTHCLTPEYINCPVFQQKKATALPPALAAPPPKRSAVLSSSQSQRSPLLWIVPLLLLLLIGGGIIWGQINQNAAVEPTAPAIGVIGTDTPTATAEPTVPTATSTTRPTETAVPTNTAAPTNTAVPTNTPSSTNTTVPTETPLPTQTPTPRPTALPTPVEIDVVVRLDSVIVRRGPDSNYSMVASTGDAGAMATAIGRSADNLWVEVCCFEEQSGWIAAGFVSLPTILDLPISTAPEVRAIISEPVLNLLENPSYSAASVATIERGETFEIIGRFGDEWIELCCVDEKSGWVYSGTALIDGDLQSIPEE